MLDIICIFVCCFFFFFQAEDGIRDLTVTGVQTCALPISTPDLVVARLRLQLPEDLRAEVEASDSVKILVAGQRGMGKTTELRRLEALLGGGEIVPVFVQFGAQESITHPMLIRAMGHTLRDGVGEKLSTKVTTRFESLFAEQTEVIEVEEGSEGSAGIGGKIVVLEAGKKIHHKDLKKTTRKTTVVRSIDELVTAFNALIEEAKRVSKRRVVFIVDDIDKIQDLSSIESTFVTASHVIGAINAPCIFTVPITYATSSSVRLAGLAYGQIYRVPAIEVVGKDGNTNQVAVDFMKEIVSRRMPFNPIPGDILQKIVLASGGVLIDGMRLAPGLWKKVVM